MVSFGVDGIPHMLMTEDLFLVGSIQLGYNYSAEL